MKQFLRLKKLITNENGIALVVVLMVLVVTSIMGVTLLELSSNSIKKSSVESNYQSTYYIAESGTTYMMNDLSSNIMNIYNQSNDGITFFNNVETMFNSKTNFTYSDFEQNSGQQPSAVIKIAKINNTNANSAVTRDYNITSVGKINNSSRTVTRTFHLTWKAKSSINIPTDTSVFVKTFISLDGGASVSGGIGTNSSLNNQIILDGGASILGNGNIYVGPNAGPNLISKPNYMVINNPIIKMPGIKTFNIPAFPGIPTSYPTPSNLQLTDSKGKNSYYVINNGALNIDNYLCDNFTLSMNQDLSFTDININSNYTLNINVGNSNRSMVVNNLSLPNGNIVIQGNGTLTIYVKGNITMGSGSVINTGGNVDKLKIYLKGSGDPSNPKNIALSGSQDIYGSLFAEDANISFSGGSGFQGHIITGGKKITISGGAYANTQLFYAPSADFTISGGGTIKGSIIANSLTATGGSDIIYQALNINNLPFISDNNTVNSATINDIMAMEPLREGN
jgi:hypothetical protein